MDIELLIAIILGIATIVFGLLWYYVQFKKLPSTKEELDSAMAEGSKIATALKEVLAFFNPESAMSETSLKTIQTIIPSNSYQMTEESLNRVLATCDSEEEKSRICETVSDYENPTTAGEECVEYTLETTNAVFRVYLGVPELIEDKTKSYTKLTQTKLSEIAGLMDGTESFAVLWKVLENERNGVREYYIDGKDKEGNDITVCVKDGEYSLLS